MRGLIQGTSRSQCYWADAPSRLHWLGRCRSGCTSPSARQRCIPEGRPVSVVIKRPSDLGKVEELIAAKDAATARPGTRKLGPRGGRTKG